MGTKSKWKNGILRFYNNAVVEENVEQLSTAGAVRGYGLTVISTTQAGTYTMGAPVPGVVKDITVGDGDGSSFAATIRCSTVANSVTIASPSSDSQNGIILTPGSTYPAGVSLRGVTTVLWTIVGTAIAGTTLMSGNTVTLTTACT